MKKKPQSIVKRYKTQDRAHRIGEGKYSYRGWKIVYDEETKRWLPINPDGDCDFSSRTLNEAKYDIDNCIAVRGSENGSF